MMPLLAQGGVISTVAYFAIILIVVGGIIGITYVILQRAGVQIPPWLITCFWIVVAVVVGILLIRFLVSLT